MQYVGCDAISHPASVTHYDLPMRVDSERQEGEQTLHVSVAHVEEPVAVGLNPVAWSDYGRRGFQENRIGAVAAHSKTREINLDFPGMGDLASGRGGELTEVQLEQLGKGRMTNLSSLFWQMLQEQDLLLDVRGNNLPVAISGHSLGTLLAAELAAAAPEGVVIQDLLLSESMALRERRPSALGLQFFLKGAKDWKRYLSMNQGMPAHASSGNIGLVRQVWTQRESHRGAVRALAGGQQEAIVREAYMRGSLSKDPEHGTRVNHVIAEKGLVRGVDGIRFGQVFEGQVGRAAANLIRPDVLGGEAHAYQDAVPALLAVRDRLAVVEAARP